jgi:hypothetical protein
MEESQLLKEDQLKNNREIGDLGDGGKTRNFCRGCIHYPCPDCDKDTVIFDCDYKE